MTNWSSSRTSTRDSACFNRAVSGRSAAEGSDTPEGWLCAMCEAGAIILAKVNLREQASGPTLSSLRGQTLNPQNLAYSPEGSCSSTAVGVTAG